ncbi:MAG: hypothetical protein ACO3UU_03580 [Minisyncoccia bacterium]
MKVLKISNLFSDKGLENLNKLINNANIDLDKNLGRSKASINLPPAEEIAIKINEIGIKNNLVFSSTTYVEYNNIFGQPNLPPHYDGDNSDLIVNFQLSSNTSWDLGLDLETYSLEDNSALIFNPNKYIHWRPIKKFESGEYIKMIFFRFCKLENMSDYSNLRYSLDDPIFDEVHRIRGGI